MAEKMMEYADKNDWSEATEGMLNYCELLRMTYEFYGQDYDLQEPAETWHKEAVKKHGFFMPSHNRRSHAFRHCRQSV